MMQEFECYHELKFGKRPRFTRRRGDADDPPSSHPLPARPPNRRSPAGQEPSASKCHSKRASGSPDAPAAGPVPSVVEPLEGVSVTGTSVRTAFAARPSQDEGTDSGDCSSQPLRPLPPELSQDPELRLLASVITRDILVTSPMVKWEDIVGLGEAKRLLQEAVVMPVLFPQIFTGILSPWSGILLVGPPGG
jgi:katanin p60 ATPase-containing subunit A1